MIYIISTHGWFVWIIIDSVINKTELKVLKKKMFLKF
jgi:hypothetical protein